jgi:HEPN domain-containing protein
MASRAQDWLRQAERDLQHARDTLDRGVFEWAAFAAQQAAEKAVKALYQGLGAEARGHAVTQLLAALPKAVRATDDLIETAKELDKHYIGPRYPNSYPEGAPMDFYTQAEAQRAVEGARRIIEHCKGHVLR